jgi:hypothetical protein
MTQNQITAISLVKDDDTELAKLTYTEPSGTPFICTPQVSPDHSFYSALESLLPEVLAAVSGENANRFEGNQVRVTGARFKYDGEILVSVSISVSFYFPKAEKEVSLTLPMVGERDINQGISFAVGEIQLAANRHLQAVPRYQQLSLLPKLEIMGGSPEETEQRIKQNETLLAIHDNRVAKVTAKELVPVGDE